MTARAVGVPLTGTGELDLDDDGDHLRAARADGRGCVEGAGGHTGAPSSRGDLRRTRRLARPEPRQCPRRAVERDASRREVGRPSGRPRLPPRPLLPDHHEGLTVERRGRRGGQHIQRFPDREAVGVQDLRLHHPRRADRGLGGAGLRPDDERAIVGGGDPGSAGVGPSDRDRFASSDAVEVQTLRPDLRRAGRVPLGPGDPDPLGGRARVYRQHIADAKRRGCSEQAVLGHARAQQLPGLHPGQEEVVAAGRQGQRRRGGGRGDRDRRHRGWPRLREAHEAQTLRLCPHHPEVAPREGRARGTGALTERKADRVERARVTHPARAQAGANAALVAHDDQLAARSRRQRDHGLPVPFEDGTHGPPVQRLPRPVHDQVVEDALRPLGPGDEAAESLAADGEVVGDGPEQRRHRLGSQDPVPSQLTRDQRVPRFRRAVRDHQAARPMAGRMRQRVGREPDRRSVHDRRAGAGAVTDPHRAELPSRPLAHDVALVDDPHRVVPRARHRVADLEAEPRVHTVRAHVASPQRLRAARGVPVDHEALPRGAGHRVRRGREGGRSVRVIAHDAVRPEREPAERLPAPEDHPAVGQPSAQDRRALEPGDRRQRNAVEREAAQAPAVHGDTYARPDIPATARDGALRDGERRQIQRAATRPDAVAEPSPVHEEEAVDRRDVARRRPRSRDGDWIVHAHRGAEAERLRAREAVRAQERAEHRGDRRGACSGKPHCARQRTPALGRCHVGRGVTSGARHSAASSRSASSSVAPVGAAGCASTTSSASGSPGVVAASLPAAPGM